MYRIGANDRYLSIETTANTLQSTLCFYDNSGDLQWKSVRTTGMHVNELLRNRRFSRVINTSCTKKLGTWCYFDTSTQRLSFTRINERVSENYSINQRKKIFRSSKTQ